MDVNDGLAAAWSAALTALVTLIAIAIVTATATVIVIVIVIVIEKLVVAFDFGVETWLLIDLHSCVLEVQSEVQLETSVLEVQPEAVQLLELVSEVRGVEMIAFQTSVLENEASVFQPSVFFLLCRTLPFASAARVGACSPVCPRFLRVGTIWRIWTCDKH